MHSPNTSHSIINKIETIVFALSLQAVKQHNTLFLFQTLTPSISLQTLHPTNFTDKK